MILEEISEQLKEAMKAKDDFTALVLRTLIAAIRNREIEKRGSGQSFDENDVIDVLRKELKKRKEALALYDQAKREDLSGKEKREIEIIEKFLPPQMSEEEIEKIVLEALKEFSSPTQKDFGAVMKKVMAKVALKADGATVSQIIKKHLS